MRSIPLLSFFGLTRELAALSSYIRIRDNSSAVIENCRSIKECTDVCVRVDTAELEIELWGNDLALTAFSENSVEVTGQIDQISLSSVRLKERRA